MAAPKVKVNYVRWTYNASEFDAAIGDCLGPAHLRAARGERCTTDRKVLGRKGGVGVLGTKTGAGAMGVAACMKLMGIGYEQALAHCKSRRPAVNPALFATFPILLTRLEAALQGDEGLLAQENSSNPYKPRLL